MQTLVVMTTGFIGDGFEIPANRTCRCDADVAERLIQLGDARPFNVDLDDERDIVEMPSANRSAEATTPAPSLPADDPIALLLSDATVAELHEWDPRITLDQCAELAAAGLGKLSLVHRSSDARLQRIDKIGRVTVGRIRDAIDLFVN